jgi:L-ascorbate metabolism protein UlaG (beta-lactamase superfamily)
MTRTEPVPRRHRREWPSSFADRLTAPVPTAGKVLRAALQGGFRTDLSAAGRIPVATAGADLAATAGDHTGLPRVTATSTAVTWVGHATYVLRVGGLTVLTDPVWSHRIPGVRPRLTGPGVAWDDLPRVDAVVISHNHYDHLDAPTIRRLPADTPILVPAGLGRWFRRRGFTDVTELDWGESAEIDGVRFDFVPAHHWSRRTPFDTCRSLWGGWIITAEHRLYFAGDTGYGFRFRDIGRSHPDIDLALMPVGAYQPRWFMHGAHVDPDEAVRACEDAGARRMAPMHWGTFVLSAEPLLEPLERARQAWRDAGRDRDDLWDLAIGESRVLD